MKGFFEVVLASEEGLAGRASSSRLQNSSWTWAHCKAAYLHLCISNLQSQKITGFTFRVCFASPFEEWEVVSWQYSCLLANPFITLLFHLLLFSTVIKSHLTASERWYKIWKTEERGKWKTKARGFWERSCRQTKENILLTGTLTAQLILCQALLFKVMSALWQFSTRT